MLSLSNEKKLISSVELELVKYYIGSIRHRLSSIMKFYMLKFY